MSRPNLPLVETGDETEEEAAAIKQHRERSKSGKELVGDAIAVTMATVDGRRFAFHVLTGLGFGRADVIGPEPHLTYANAGQLRYAMMLYNQLKTSHPDKVKLMMMENDL